MKSLMLMNVGVWRMAKVAFDVGGDEEAIWGVEGGGLKEIEGEARVAGGDKGFTAEVAIRRWPWVLVKKFDDGEGGGEVLSVCELDFF